MRVTNKRRPPSQSKGPRQLVSVRLTLKEHEFLEAIATQTGLSFTDVMAQCLMAYGDKVKCPKR